MPAELSQILARILDEVSRALTTQEEEAAWASLERIGWLVRFHGRDRLHRIDKHQANPQEEEAPF